MDAVALDGGLYRIHNVEVYRPVICVFAPCSGGEADIAVSEFLYVNGGEHSFLCQHHGVIGEELEQYAFYLFYVAVIGNADQELKSAVGCMGVVDDAVIGDLTVGDLNQLLVGGVQLGVEKTDVTHGACLSACLYVITDLEGMVGDYLNAAENVAEEVLDRKREGNSDDGEHGDQGGNGNAQAAQHYDDRNTPKESLYDGSQYPAGQLVKFGAVQRSVQDSQKDLYGECADNYQHCGHNYFGYG